MENEIRSRQQAQAEQISRGLMQFIEQSPSCFHVIHNFKEQLTEAGFEELREESLWNVTGGHGYFVTRNDSSIIAFYVPEGETVNFQLFSAHSDSPTFKIKENPEMPAEGHYVKLNTEKYGGMLCAPWFDRPLSIAGRVMIKNGTKVVTRLVDIDRDLVMIPNVAIHMNRTVNDGYAYNPQKDMIPLFGDEKAEGTFANTIAAAAGVATEDILGTDLFLYNRMPGTVWGAAKEYISCGKLDDLQCAYSGMEALKKAVKEGKVKNSIVMCCVFDNEEVGSSTKQGADSTFLSDVMERISMSLGKTQEMHKMAIAGSFMLSADNAHAVHPNKAEMADPTNRPFMNEGIVIKGNANQKYTTDAVSMAVFKTICEKASVPTQSYVNRSDIAGGSTLGNIANTHVSMNTVDIGLPQLAMHSPYETAGVMDTMYMEMAAEEFFASTIVKNGSDYEII